jgi:hypothetical protein
VDGLTGPDGTAWCGKAEWVNGGIGWGGVTGVGAWGWQAGDAGGERVGLSPALCRMDNCMAVISTE